MPQFELDTSGKAYRSISETTQEAVRWSDLDDFTAAYIEALFFTESSPAYLTDEWFSAECEEARREGQADGTIPGDMGFSDLHPDALAAVIADCTAFQTANADDLSAAYAAPDLAYGEAQAGHDYWLTRNGHGAGYWDRGLGAIGDRLSAACRHDSVDVYLSDDGRVCL